MSILKVARLGHPVLRKRARELNTSEVSSPEIQQLINDMFQTMHEYQGIGLAAPQVHQSLQIFVAGVDDPEVGVPAVVMINPEIVPTSDTIEEDWEGCLSIPDIRGLVPRSTDIRVHSLDRNGNEQSMTASGYAARVIQHETDHLNGILFLDRMNSLSSLTFLSEYERYSEQGESD